MITLFILCVCLLFTSINAVVKDRTRQNNILLVVDAQRCFSKNGSLAVSGADEIMPMIDRLMDLEHFNQVIFTQDWHPVNHVSFASNHWADHPYLAHPKLKRGRDKRTHIVHRAAPVYQEIVLAYTQAGHLCGYEDIYASGRSCPGLDLSSIQSLDFDASSSLVSAATRSFTEPSTNVTYTLVKQMLWPDHCVANTQGAELHPLLRELPPHASTLKKGNADYIDSYSAFADAAHLSRTSITELIDRSHPTHVYVVGLALDYCVYFSAIDARLLERFEVTIIQDATRPVSNHRAEQVTNDMRRRGIRVIDVHQIPGYDQNNHDDL